MEQPFPELRSFDVSGTPEQMGELFGEAFREEILALAEIRMAKLAQHVGRYDPPRLPSRDHILEAARATVDAHCNYDSAIWSEFQGIARGSGIPEEALLVANALTDLRDLVLLETPPERLKQQAPAGECTAFVAPAECAGGAPIVGQTWDMHPEAVPYTLVVRRRPRCGPATLALTTVGCLPLIGMNEEGVAVATNNLAPVDARPGVSYLFTITRALACRSAGEAVSTIERTPRLSGHNFIVADEESAVNIETTARRAVKTPARDAVAVHANHYLDPGNAALEITAQDLRGSRYRQSRLGAHFARARRPLTADACWRFLADSQRGEGAICNEDYEGEYGFAATVATVVLCPCEGRIDTCSGGARLGARQRFDL